LKPRVSASGRIRGATCPEGRKLTMDTVRKIGFTPVADQLPLDRELKDAKTGPGREPRRVADQLPIDRELKAQARKRKSNPGKVADQLPLDRELKVPIGVEGKHRNLGCRPTPAR
ncbi:MAG: hypothetical protein ACR2GU_03550, partial [Rubrobacteraceae bacterium]